MYPVFPNFGNKIDIFSQLGGKGYIRKKKELLFVVVATIQRGSGGICLF